METVRFLTLWHVQNAQSPAPAPDKDRMQNRRATSFRRRCGIALTGLAAALTLAAPAPAQGALTGLAEFDIPAGAEATTITPGRTATCGSPCRWPTRSAG
jgi:hypothetical protein